MTKSEIVMVIKNPGPYQIWRHRRYDEHCKLSREWFTVDEWGLGWFKEKWRPWKYMVYHGLAPRYRVTDFSSLDDAKAAINRYMTGMPRDGRASIVVETLP